MYSFRDPVTNVLTSWGYQESNCRLWQPTCDTRQEEAWDFNLEPYKWQWDGTKWIPWDGPGPIVYPSLHVS